MSEKTYLLDLHYKDTGLSFTGIVGENVVDKIKKKQFVEFNLLMGYNDGEEGGEYTSNYRRLYYSPVAQMKVNIREVTPEENIDQCLD